MTKPPTPEATIRIVPIDDAETAVWRLAGEVTQILDGLPWVLIGGLMVRIIESEHGATTLVTTGDVDTLLDVRMLSTASQQAAQRLQTAHFEPQHSSEGVTYRFVRGDDIVDVLVPDHLGNRSNILTVPPDETLEAVGGRQALNRRRVVRIDAGDGPFEIPVPSLIGAIVIKARVVENTTGKESHSKHQRDLARLLALVRDPASDRAQLSAKERGYLRSRTEMLDSGHAAWARVSGAEDGVISLSILSEANG